MTEVSSDEDGTMDEEKEEWDGPWKEVRRVTAMFDPRETREGLSVRPLGHRTNLEAKRPKGKAACPERLDTRQPPKS